jgi:hypothetical protein
VNRFLSGGAALLSALGLVLAAGLIEGGVSGCGAPPNPCSAEAITARTAATVAAVELLADDECNLERSSCDVAQAGLRKLEGIERECAAKAAKP